MIHTENYVNDELIKLANIFLNTSQYILDFKSNEKFGTIINSESIQYIDLDTAFESASQLLIENGQWIITDYFRKNESGINKSGHLHQDFLNKIEQYNWKIIHEQDMTLNALPTLKFAITFIERFLNPLTFFINDKMQYKLPWLFYLTKELRERFSKKSKKELVALDPKKFLNEKKYMLYVLEKK